MAMKRLGVDFEHYRCVEFDKYPVASYNAIHGTNFEPLDITKIKGEDLGIVDIDHFTYLLTYSFPCFTGEMMVLTKNGYKQIKDVKAGDSVLTHNNSYKNVIASKPTGTQEIYSIKGMCFDEIRCTGNHKFYVRKMVRHYPTYENGKRGRTREFLQPEWVECKDLNKTHYMGVAINKESIMPICDLDYIEPLLSNYSFWYVMGRFVGDGWFASDNRIVICGDNRKMMELSTHLDNCGFRYSINAERTCYKCTITYNQLGIFGNNFGKGAKNKHIPGFMFDMPCDYLRSFLAGYITSDGCYTQERYKITSVSRELIYGTAQLIAKVYQTPYKIYHTKRPKTCLIEGRTVNQNDTYQLVWKTEKKKQDKAFYEDGYVWFPIKEIVNTKERECVYDIEVDDDHSFVVNGVIAHNCQDLSVAGKGRGMTKGSGTRSGLLWEVERLLNEVENLPQVLLMENVPQVHGKKNMDDFQDWIAFLESKGYTNFWKDLNAKDYGVAQNRNRTFMVSILGHARYTFPEPIELTKVMKDYLEEEVDEKYYVKSQKALELIERLKSEGISLKD